jgi:glycine/D-amino acid oxidase-like deaminating enzyme
MLIMILSFPLLPGVTVDGKVLPAMAVVIAMGPWSADAALWFPGLPRIGGQKAHSILVRPQAPVGADCLFAQIVTSSGALLCI